MRTLKNVSKITPVHTSALCKGKKGMGGVVLAVAGVALLIGGIWVGSNMMSKDSPTLTVGGTAPSKTTKISDNTPASANFCGANGVTSFDAIVLNPLDNDGTPTYLATNLRVFEKDGRGTMMSYTTKNDGTFADNSLELACPGEYKVYIPAVTNTTASGIFDLQTDRAVKSINAEINRLGFVQLRAYDNLNNDNVFDHSSTAATAYKDLEDGNIVFKSTADNSTAYAMGVGGELDWTFRVKTPSQTAWGDVENFLVIDADASDYEMPAIYFQGKPLVEVGKAALPHRDDAGYLSNYEYVYRLPSDIGERASELRMIVNAKGSINPDKDIVMRFVAGSYSIDGVTPRYSVFDRGGNEILMSARTITIDIS